MNVNEKEPMNLCSGFLKNIQKDCWKQGQYVYAKINILQNE